MEEFVSLPVATIRESPINPRKTFSEKALAELERSVVEAGNKILVPLLVRPEISPGEIQGYEILAGARRHRVATKLGLEFVPCRVLEGLSDRQALEIMVVENLQRDDVPPLEEADGYRELMQIDVNLHRRGSREEDR
jgi:ParB family transcriptional regulator, chromosome partitioning protein